MNNTPFEVTKPWGYFRQFTKNEPATVKIISVKAGESLSLQSHDKRSEFWRITNGGGIVTVGDKQIPVKKDDEINIQVGEKHRISAGEEGVEFLEICFGDFDEADIQRYEDKYGRI